VADSTARLNGLTELAQRSDRNPRNELGSVRRGAKSKTAANYFDSGLSLSRSGVEGAKEEDEREETGDAAGVVGDGAVADSTVVVGSASVEDDSGVECPNTFDRNLVNIPMTDTTPCSSQSPMQCAKQEAEVTANIE
jgi:hypothetical protein